MKRFIIASALLLGSVLTGQAALDIYWYDLIRPNGQPRNDATFEDAINSCDQQAGIQYGTSVSPAFKACMRGLSYRFVSSRRQRIPHLHTWIDVDTGGTCYHGTFMGMPSIECTPGDNH